MIPGCTDGNGYPVLDSRGTDIPCWPTSIIPFPPPLCGSIAMTTHPSTFEIPPFPAFPSASRFLPIGSLEESRQRIKRSIDACEGLALVIGPPGTGKSLLCAVMTREYSRSHDVVNLGDTSIHDAATFYRHLLHHLGAKIDSIPDGDLQLALINRVRDPKATEKGLLVLVDEAQSMSPEVLEAVRMTTNIMLDGQPRVYAIVCGGPKLDETLALPVMEPLTQRVAARCYLHPLSSQETRRYIRESIQNCEANPDAAISDEAIAAVHHASSGVPRLINQLITCAIDVAAELDHECITDAIIDHAWAELQQLPSPMIEEPSFARNSSNVEFGELDEMPTVPRRTNEPAIDWTPAEALDFDDALGESLTSDAVSQRNTFETSPACRSGACGQGECDQAGCERQDGDPDSPGTSQSVTSNPSKESTTPPIIALFGDFDDEEEVQVGNGFAVVTEGDEQGEWDLESILHSEIVGIAQEASLASGSCAEPDVCDQPDVKFSTRVSSRDRLIDENPVQWIDEAVGTGKPMNDDSDIVIHDDSDLLVIEDDLHLRADACAPRIDAEERTVSVDFQAMLSRMRHGTSKDAS